MNKLTQSEAKDHLSELANWRVKENVLHKEFTFTDFSAAFSFMSELAAKAEELNHHPDWSNSYNTVYIKLTTHSAGGLTKKDFIFAQAADSFKHKY